jgi:hypothetical protein
MKPTFVVYVDESGDEGFSFGKGSPEWFVLSGVVTRKGQDLQVVKLVDGIRAQLGKPHRAPLHFKDLKHEQRLPLVDAIANADLRAVSVLVHKPSLKEPERFQERYRLYFYCVRLLLERVSWLCRDHKRRDDAGDGSATVAFSNRAGMSYKELKDYLAHLKERTGPLDVRVDWSVISPSQITSYAAGKRAGLQISDAVASGFFRAVEPSQHGFTEDRYVRMLRPIVYHRRGNYTGYGVKFWPREVDELLRSQERFRWVRDAYGGA